MKRIPKTKEDFAWTQWDADTIRRVASEILAKKKEIYTQIKSINAAERTFENTVYAIEYSGDVMVPAEFMDILLNASPDESVRKACEESTKMIRQELVDIEYDEDLYRSFTEFAEKNVPLEGEEKKLFEDMDRDYKRMGFHLSPEKREELKNYLRRMNDISTDFGINIRDYEDHILVTREELDGLPENYIDDLQKSEDGRYIVSLKYPETGPFLENATNGLKRKELMDKHLRKGGEKNVELAKELLELRGKRVELLGYPTHADYVTEERMAKNAKTVVDFLSDLMNQLQPLVDQDYEAIRGKKRAMIGDPQAGLEYYETGYYAKQLEKERFNIDSEKIREYFPLDHVLGQMFQIYGTLFGIEFKKRDDLPTWHSDASVYEVLETETQEVLGYSLLDLFPRKNKYGHMACWYLLPGRAEGFKSDRYISPCTSILGNFNKPTAQRSSLISHDEVQTLFHEFGHALHNLLTKARFGSQSGTSVAYDFVEVPSQFNEYWVWDKNLLARLSKHYQTGVPLPAETIKNMIKGKNHLIAWITMRQAIYAFFDITVHGKNPPKDMADFCNELIEKHQHIKFPPNLFPAGFGHFVGYDAGYYSYLWSRVICADLFTRFKKEGILNQSIGKEYRDKVLAVGGSRDEVETVKEFLGREPNNEAFLEEIGLKKI